MALATQPPETDLVGRVRSGSPEALAELYSAHGPAVFRLAYRLLGSREDAEDLVHDLFVGLPEALLRYQERGSLLPWLKRVAVRMSLMRRRSTIRRREVSLDVAEPDAIAPPITDHGELLAAVNALPDTLRTVLVLKEIEGFSHTEVAELLGITPGGSRARLARAVKRLRNQLGTSQ